MPEHLHIHETSGFWPSLDLGPIEIPTYYLFISLAASLAVVWLVRRADRQGLDRIIALDAVMATMIGGFVGARLFHIFFENPEFYRARPLDVFKFWQGGFVFYGGALAGAAAGYAVLRRKRQDVPLWFDLAAPVIAMSYALGRVACWLTGCCYGDVCVLPSGLAFRHPTQAYAVLWESALLASLLLIERRRSRKKVHDQSRWGRTLAHPGAIFQLWLLLHGIGRIVMEAFRADFRGPQPLGLSVSTWISFALISIAATGLFRAARSASERAR